VDYKAIPLKGGVYILKIPNMVTENPMPFWDEIILELHEKILELEKEVLRGKDNNRSGK
jgi:hypothetical protein